jgi:signal transduction histidine kinase
MGRLRRLSLRARLMLVSVAALVVGLAAGGVVLVGVLNFALLRAVHTETLDTARAVANLVDQDALGDPIPATPGMQVQVVDAQGRVRAVSASTDRLVPILYPEEMRDLPDGQAHVIPGDRIGLTGPVRVVAVGAGRPGDPVRVLVARSTADVAQGVHLLRITLLVAFPLLVGLLAAVSWRVLGAALRPVEALRAGAEEITGGARPDRLPVPDSGDEIHRLAVTLNGMLHRLDAARARQRAFVADAAHELRSPLTNMRTELEVAQRIPDGTDWPALADDLLTDVERLSRLVDDLLLLARADDAATRAATPIETVELGRLLAEVAARYPAVKYERPAVPLRVEGEPDALGRVVANLLDNAARHAASTVTLAVGADGAYQRITVCDDGPGIPPGDRERVFDRFTRLDDGRARDAGGAGLGLAIVRELVRRHAGTVTLGDAEPGLRVEVRLPKSSELSGAGRRPTAEPGSQRKARPQ